MTRLRVIIVLGVLATAPAASAACRWLGTQLDCDVGAGRVVIGTQAAEHPTYAGSLPIHPFQADGQFPEDRPASRHPFEFDLQGFGADPSLCRNIMNETYCY